MDASGERVARQDAEAARLPDQGPGGRAKVDTEGAALATASEVDQALGAVDFIALHGIVVDGSDQPVTGARVAVFQDHMTNYARWFEFGPAEVEEGEEVEEIFESFEELEIEEQEVEEPQGDRAADQAPEEPLWASTLSDAGGRFILELPSDALERTPLISASAEGFIDAQLIPLADDNFQVLRLETPASVRLPVRMPPRLEDDHRAVMHVERDGRRVLSTAVWSYVDTDQPELKDLDPGAYRIVIEVGCAYWPVYETEFDLLPGELRHLDEVRLDETVARVQVELRTAGGAALSNAEVELWTGTGWPLGSSGADGSSAVDANADGAAPQGPASGAAACTGLRTDALGQLWLTVSLAELPLTLAVKGGTTTIAGSLTAAHASAPGIHVLTLTP